MYCLMVNSLLIENTDNFSFIFTILQEQCTVPRDMVSSISVAIGQYFSPVITTDITRTEVYLGTR